MQDVPIFLEPSVEETVPVPKALLGKAPDLDGFAIQFRTPIRGRGHAGTASSHSCRQPLDLYPSRGHLKRLFA